MAKNRTQNVMRNIFTGFIGKIVNIFLPFIIRTVIINGLGVEYLGLNSLFSSIFNMLNLTEFGFSNAIIYQMYKPASENDVNELSVLLGVYRRIYHIIGIVMTVIGLGLMPFLPHFISGSYPNDVNIYILYIVYLGNTVLPFYTFGYRISILLAYQRLDIQNVINMVISLFMNIMQVIVIILFRNYYAYIILLPIFTLLNNIITMYISRKKYSEIKPIMSFSKDRLKGISMNAGAAFGHKLNYIIVSAADSIVLSSFLGLVVLAKYSNYYTVLMAVIGLIDVIFNSMLPSIGNLLIDNDREKTFSIYNMLSYIQYWIVGWCTICLICLYQDFMMLWMGEALLLPISTVVMFGIYLYSYKGRSVLLMYKDAAGMWREDWKKPYVSAGVNLILNIILVNIIGVNGVLLSTIISFVFVSAPWESVVVFKTLFKRPVMLHFKSLFKYIALCLISAIFTYKICDMIIMKSLIMQLGVKFIVCLIVPNLVFFSVTNKTDAFGSFKLYVLRLMRKIKV